MKVWSHYLWNELTFYFHIDLTQVICKELNNKKADVTQWLQILTMRDPDHLRNGKSVWQVSQNASTKKCKKKKKKYPETFSILPKYRWSIG